MGILNLNHRVIWICEPMWGVLFILIIYHKQRWARHLARTTLDLKFWSFRKLRNSDAFSALFTGQNRIFPWYLHLKKVGDIWNYCSGLIWLKAKYLPRRLYIWYLSWHILLTKATNSEWLNNIKTYLPNTLKFFIFINFTSRPHFGVGGEAFPPPPPPLPTD